MYLLDDQDQIVDAECWLDLFEDSPCVVVESSGGANPERGVKRRNPKYNQLLSLIFTRLALSGTEITQVVLDSNKVFDIPIEDRVVNLDQPYPVDLTSTDIEDFRVMLQRKIALTHRDPGAASGGNRQKRIRICLSKPISADQLLTQPGSVFSPDEVPAHAPGLNETEKEYLSTARVGQGQFRQNLLEAYGGTCPVTGIANAELLIASHIKPWKACNNSERLDPNNGILLSALVDRLFDRGLISFSDDGRIVVSPTLSHADSKRCGLDRAPAFKLFESSRRYMEYHRAIEFKST